MFYRGQKLSFLYISHWLSNVRPHTTCTRPDLVQAMRGGWSPTNFKVGQPDQVRHKGLWVQSFWKRDSYQLDLAQISKCWTLKSKGAIDESRNLHLNSPPRLGLCIFLKILKTSLGSLDSMTLVQSISETSVHCTYVKLWLESLLALRICPCILSLLHEDRL